MQPIKDMQIAEALRAKVSDFNLRGAGVPALMTVGFVVLPLAFGWP